MKKFTLEDFSGSGQYLVRMCPQQKKRVEDGKDPYVIDTSFLSTVMFKVGWLTNNYNIGESLEQVACLIAMSDGMVRISHYDKKKGNELSEQKTTWVGEEEGVSGKQKFVDYLNADDTPTYRFATQEEVIRVVAYQKSRWRG